MPHPTLKINTPEERQHVLWLLSLGVPMEWHNVRVEIWVQTNTAHAIKYLRGRTTGTTEYTQIRMRIREDDSH